MFDYLIKLIILFIILSLFVAIQYVILSFCWFIIHPTHPKAQIWSRILKRTFGGVANGPTLGARKMTWQATNRMDLRRGDRAAFFGGWLTPLLFIIHPTRPKRKSGVEF